MRLSLILLLITALATAKKDCNLKNLNLRLSFPASLETNDNKTKEDLNLMKNNRNKGLRIILNSAEKYPSGIMKDGETGTYEYDFSDIRKDYIEKYFIILSNGKYKVSERNVIFDLKCENGKFNPERIVMIHMCEDVIDREESDSTLIYSLETTNTTAGYKVKCLIKVLNGNKLFKEVDLPTNNYCYRSNITNAFLGTKANPIGLDSLYDFLFDGEMSYFCKKGYYIPKTGKTSKAHCLDGNLEIIDCEANRDWDFDVKTVCITCFGYILLYVGLQITIGCFYMRKPNPRDQRDRRESAPAAAERAAAAAAAAAAESRSLSQSPAESRSQSPAADSAADSNSYSARWEGAMRVVSPEEAQAVREKGDKERERETAAERERAAAAAAAAAAESPPRSPPPDVYEY